MAEPKQSCFHHPQQSPLHGVVPGVHTRKHHAPPPHTPGPPLAPHRAAPVHEGCAAERPLASGAGSITFSVNGAAHTVSAGEGVDPHTTLAAYLRDTLALTGTKIGCGEGGCGACTVLISRADAAGKMQTGLANACLRPLLSLDGSHVVTTEGVGSAKGGFGPVRTSSPIASRPLLRVGQRAPAR